MAKGRGGGTNNVGGGGRPTLEDVAWRAGVSTATVSRAINFPKKVAGETVSRVQAAIAQTGYVPNLLAGGLASNRSRFVAALAPSIASSIFNDTMEAMSRALSSEGYLVMLALLDEGPGRIATLDSVMGRRPDGLILTSIEDDDLGGNVWEWCEDAFDTGSNDRVVRGGSWSTPDAFFSRSSHRPAKPQNLRDPSYGFRVVLVP